MFCIKSRLPFGASETIRFKSLILRTGKLRPREGCTLGKGHTASVQRCLDQMAEIERSV